MQIEEISSKNKKKEKSNVVGCNLDLIFINKDNDFNCILEFWKG